MVECWSIKSVCACPKDDKNENEDIEMDLWHSRKNRISSEDISDFCGGQIEGDEVELLRWFRLVKRRCINAS